ncbi:MAG: nucleotidyltransferase domain-containing protein [Sulfurimonas sp.]|jgi:predicted nucleotidyltransferase|uniref:nucleotidyltransferase family protein n=1 Tax=Sulfurimonas sp. TaxID=2022749 RepID=UPI0035687123
MRATKDDILHYLKELKAEFSKDGITTFALFGSFAKDTHGVYSDIDVAIAKSSDYLSYNSSYAYFETIAKIKDKIRKKFHRNSDVFDLDSQSSFKETIQKELIYV